jgi:rhodanese-related sulfurtransferase
VTAVTSCETLYAQLGLPGSPALVDVRTEDDYRANPVLIPGARRRAPGEVASWARSLPRDRFITVYCKRGGETSGAAAAALTALGYPVATLAGGIEGWIAENRATIRVRPELDVPGASRWVTRERPKIDRLACPWLVRRFIDQDALFFYSPAHRVRSEAQALDAQPYDIADVLFSHRGARCSFDAFLDEFAFHDPVMDAVADIVRAADTGELANSAQAPGLLAISLGLSATITDDILLLEQAMPIYDALYAWCKTARHETHSWPTKPA